MPKVLVPGNLIVPITARNLNCVEKIRDFVSNNRYSTGLLGMLSESMLSCEQRQPIRAFIQLGPKVEGKVDKSWQSSEDIKQERSKNLGTASNKSRHKKTCLRGLRPGKTQTGLLSYRT